MPPLLFVAVVPPPEATAELAARVAAVRASPAGAGLRWESPSRWHVTLAFLGPVEPTDGLDAELAAVAGSVPPPTLQVAGAGRFGRTVLWAGLTGPLDELAAAVRFGCARAGLPAEDRPFRAHLTLARAGRGAPLGDALRALADVTGPTFVAQRLALLQSARPEYAVRAQWPLTGSRR